MSAPGGRRARVGVSVNLEDLGQFAEVRGTTS